METTALVPVGKKRTSKKPPRRTTKNRQTTKRDRAVADLVGLAGEIHVFRMLQRQYGTERIQASSWVSTNSLHCFPGNRSTVDDGKGYDFEFWIGRKRHLVEVKSTVADEPGFEMGQSEVRAAMEAARKTRDPYLVIRVSFALDETPTAEVLPNPFNPRHAAIFRFDGAGMRVRYKRKG